METKNLEVNKLDILSSVDGDNGKLSQKQKLPTALEIQSRLMEYLSELLEIKPHEIDVTVSFDRYGLDSAAVVGMTGDLENLLGRQIPSDLPYKFPTIETLAQHLAA